MSKLHIDDSIKQLHWQYIQDNILDRISQEFDRADGNTDYSRLLNYCRDNAYEIAIGNYCILQKHLSIIQDIKNIDIDNVVNNCNYNKNGKKRNKLLDIYDYDSFSKIRRHGQQEWSPYIYIEKMKVRVCPYCNRHYITTINTDKRAYRADIDHFLPKSKYPFFAMSLGNWIPSCMPCNRSLKGKKEFEEYPANPYVEDYNKIYDFVVDIDDSLKVQKLYIQEKLNSFTKIKDMFALDEQYKYHIDIAQKFIDISQKYPNERIKDMMNLVGVEYSEREKAYLIGYPETVDEIDKEVLGKLKRDMAKFVGYIC